MGHVVGFEQLVEEEFDSVVRSLTIAFGDREAAEDCVQVGFERAPSMMACGGIDGTAWHVGVRRRGASRPTSTGPRSST